MIAELHPEQIGVFYEMDLFDVNSDLFKEEKKYNLYRDMSKHEGVYSAGVISQYTLTVSRLIPSFLATWLF